MKFMSVSRFTFWLLLVVLLCAERPALAQAEDPVKPAVVAPPDPAEPAEPPKPAEPAEPPSENVTRNAQGDVRDAFGEARRAVRDALKEARGIRVEAGSDGEFVGVANNVTVAENETAGVVVAVFADIF